MHTLTHTCSTPRWPDPPKKNTNRPHPALNGKSTPHSASPPPTCWGRHDPNVHWLGLMLPNRSCQCWLPGCLVTRLAQTPTSDGLTCSDPGASFTWGLMMTRCSSGVTEWKLNYSFPKFPIIAFKNLFKQHKNNRQILVLKYWWFSSHNFCSHFSAQPQKKNIPSFL